MSDLGTRRLAESDAELLAYLRQQLPAQAHSVDRLVVSLEEQPDAAVALLLNPEWELIGVGPAAATAEQTFVRFEVDDPTAPLLIRKLIERFGATLAFRICPECHVALGFDGCPH